MRWVAATLILCSLSSAISLADTRAAKSADMVEMLSRISRDEKVHEYLGVNGQILEIASYELGVAILYTTSTEPTSEQRCTGFYSFDSDSNDYVFRVDGRCAKALSQVRTSDDLEFHFIRDIEVLTKAALFIKNFKVLQPPVQQVIGLMKMQNRVVVRYHSPHLRNPVILAISPIGRNAKAWEVVQPVAYIDR